MASTHHYTWSYMLAYFTLICVAPAGELHFRDRIVGKYNNITRIIILQYYIPSGEIDFRKLFNDVLWKFVP